MRVLPLPIPLLCYNVVLLLHVHQWLLLISVFQCTIIITVCHHMRCVIHVPQHLAIKVSDWYSITKLLGGRSPVLYGTNTAAVSNCSTCILTLNQFNICCNTVAKLTYSFKLYKISVYPCCIIMSYLHHCHLHETI